MPTKDRPSVENDDQYEALKKKGTSKERAGCKGGKAAARKQS